MDKDKLKSGLRFCISNTDCKCNGKICPYYFENTCINVVAADALEYIEQLEERIAIMTEGQDAVEEIPFCYDDAPDESSKDDEYV